MEVNENKGFILYLAITGDAQPLARNQCFSTCCSGRQVLCSKPAPCFPSMSMTHIFSLFLQLNRVIWCGIFLLCQSIILAVLPPKTLLISSLLGGRSIGEAVLLQPQRCSSRALAVIASPFLATSAKHSTARAAVGKSNSIHSQTQRAMPASRPPL